MLLMRRFSPFLISAFTVALSAASVSLVYAGAEGFRTWTEQFISQAVAAGINPNLANQALSEAQFLPRVIDLDRKQPENTRTFNEYKTGVVSQARIDQGRQMLRQHRALLTEIEKKYGVPAPVIVALWGIETNYGKNTGGFEIIDALATLAYEGRRHDFFRDELLNALHIIQDGHITLHAMRGSWAGAMGQNQFMPSSFKRFAVDYNGDNRRDIWGTLPDVFASSANYLSKSGWQAGERWGRKVILPANFNASYIGLEKHEPVSTWTSRGVKLSNGQALPESGMTASIVRPQKSGRAAYLVYNNYRTIMKWNNSTFFATSVGLLSDLIAQEPR
jgi:membrane-bound lytic murein transglycosylase B